MTVEVHAYAIVSADDRIADARGQMPESLRNDADWTYFQAELDRADLIAIGRTSHEATPNARGRRRLILSRGVQGLEARKDGWWWNPRTLPGADVCARLLPEGGRAATPGGQAAFDVFLAIGLTAFHLSRAERVRLPGGLGLFRACEEGRTADEVLASAGLRAGAETPIDPAAEVSLTLWRRPQIGANSELETPGLWS